MNYYIPPKKPSRGDDDDSDKGTSPSKQAGMGAIRDIVSRGGPMSEGKKSVAFSQVGKGGASNSNQGARGKEESLKLVELAAIYERPDIGNPNMNNLLEKVYQGRKKIRDRIVVDSPVDHRSRASKRSANRRGTLVAGKGTNTSAGFASINDSIVQSQNENTMNQGDTNLMGNLTMNKTLIGKLSQKMEARNFKQDFAQVDKTLAYLGAEKYDTCEDIAML